MTLFSLIVPTRGRIAEFGRMLESLGDTARDPASFEVIAVIDEDDAASRAFSFSGLRLERVIVPPGLAMGKLNLAGYGASRGRNLMLLNDDVLAHTNDWDAQLDEVLRSYSDGVVLAHVNDLLFRDNLCSFPVLTRDFCELAGGICPPDYRRYRIDDDIHHVFDLIHLLGHTRRIYMPEVIFEHRNGVRNKSGTLNYTPDPALHRVDSGLFAQRIGQRRALALACVERIEGVLTPQQRESRARLLEEYPATSTVGRRQHARWWYSAGAPTGFAARPRASLISRVAPWVCQMRAELAARRPAFRRLGVEIPAALFDAEWYRATYREADADAANPLLDYLRRGGFEGRDPNPHFDSTWYLQVNPDVASSGLNPLVHFVRYGAREGRNPSLLFDVAFYQSENPEIVAAGVNPLEHFIAEGLKRGRSPLPRVTVAEYWRRLQFGKGPGRVELRTPARLSVVIPTRNRKETLAKTLDACLRCRGECEFELLVVDDGSEDGTAEFLRGLSLKTPLLRFESVPHGGPGRARNIAAIRARHEVLLFLGDDITPGNAEFFRVHADRHAADAGLDFAVLGKMEWPPAPEFPVSFVMARAQQDGAQFAYTRLKPNAFAGWQHFYSSNLSLKKARVRDWATEGFNTDFRGAELEDIEFGYRLSRTPPGIRLYYDPRSLGWHYHHYELGPFLDRQVLVGRSLRRLLALHPELAAERGVQRIEQALHSPRGADEAGTRRRAIAETERWKDAAGMLESRGTLGSEPWHGELLSALFELSIHEGYISACPEDEVNLAAARELMLNRLLSRIRAAPVPHAALANLPLRDPALI